MNEEDFVKKSYKEKKLLGHQAIMFGRDLLCYQKRRFIMLHNEIENAE